MLQPSDGKITVAWIGLITTILGALVTAILSYRASRRNQADLQAHQRELETQKQTYTREIAQTKAYFDEKLELKKSGFTDINAEKQARRDYEYEARKRLYKECEPLLFRLSEASENALHRIFSLARTARMGDLGPIQPNWLQGPGYYMASTIYHLLAPLVIFRLLQNKLTLVDLTVDQRISNQYLIAKSLYISFTEDFVLAQMPPTLEYRPFARSWEEKRKETPENYWRQGLTLGRLDIAVEGMIKRIPDGVESCMSFGEFEKALHEDIQRPEPTFGALIDVFWYFHPVQRPILWRILVVQAHLHAKLMQDIAKHGATGFVTPVPADYFGTDLARLDWRQPAENRTETAILEPVHVARDYLSNQLPAIFQRAETAEG